MRLRYFIVVIVLILIITACKTNAKWENYGGYKIDYDSKFEHYIVLDKIDTTYDYLWDTGEITRYDGAFIKYHLNNSTIDTIFISNGGIVIQSFIDDVVFDDSFILVDQKPLGKICEVDYPKDKNASTFNQDEFMMDRLKESNMHDYWIILKKTNEIYGPLTKKDYLDIKKKLNVPSNLSLRTEQP